MYGSFPQRRLRRLRRLPQLRDLVRETQLSIDNLIYPLFVIPGKGVKKEVSAMPGVYHFSIDKLMEEIKAVYDLGVKAVILFGIPEKKDEQGSEAYSATGIIQQAIKAIKQQVKNLVVITDVCLCEYTSHGHCGIVKTGVIDNDATLDLLAKTALSQVQAGADMVAPSDMMDGRVRRIRESLDDNGFELIPIMSYAAKYASAFYGPFREAAQSTPAFGDRRSHQMDPANVREAELEILLDLQEGADIIMVKPALAYLDVIYRVKQQYLVPVAAYNVSGEYAMIKAAGAKGWIDPEATMWECLLSIKRAGADLILTYFAKQVAEKLAQK